MKRQNQNSKRGSSAPRTALYQAVYKLHALPSDLLHHRLESIDEGLEDFVPTSTTHDRTDSQRRRA
jgi:hypothetical protein